MPCRGRLQAFIIVWGLSVEITRTRNFVHECTEFSFFYCSRSTNQGCVVSRDVATSTRSTTLDGSVDTYVVSHDVATGTRLMTLDGSIHCSARSKTRVLHALVSPEVVRLCRCFVYCTGSPPPGMVSCAGIFYSWRRVCLLP